MYESHYGFRRPPFSLLPDPEFFYLCQRRKSALKVLEHSLARRTGLTVITGEPGSGKTSLVRHYLRHVGPRVTGALVTITNRSFDDFLMSILSAFKLEPMSSNRHELLRVLTDYLLKEYASDRQCMLIVDEAHTIDFHAIGQLCMLSNANRNEDQALQIILVGEPKIVQILNEPELRQFTQYMVHHRLEPFEEIETREYLRHRVMVAGGGPGLFDDHAQGCIHYLCKGVPRSINSFCDKLLIWGSFCNKQRIELEDIPMFLESISEGELTALGLTSKTRSEIAKILASHVRHANQSAARVGAADSSHSNSPGVETLSDLDRRNVSGSPSPATSGSSPAGPIGASLGSTSGTTSVSLEKRLVGSAPQMQRNRPELSASRAYLSSDTPSDRRQYRDAQTDARRSAPDFARAGGHTASREFRRESRSSRTPICIALGNEKGGTGKSTVAIHLIVSLLKLGYSVGSIDLDGHQGTLSSFIENRETYARSHGLNLSLPLHRRIEPSGAMTRQLAEGEERNMFGSAYDAMADRDFVVIDTPGHFCSLSRLGHAQADILITPLNDSFIDIEILAQIDREQRLVLGPSSYCQMVWQTNETRTATGRKPLDWIVIRNRLAQLDARNNREMKSLLDRLSNRIGCRLQPGFSERVIFRELFFKGCTLLDLPEEDLQTNESHGRGLMEIWELLESLGVARIDRPTLGENRTGFSYGPDNPTARVRVRPMFEHRP